MTVWSAGTWTVESIPSAGSEAVGIAASGRGRSLLTAAGLAAMFAVVAAYMTSGNVDKIVRAGGQPPRGDVTPSSVILTVMLGDVAAQVAAIQAVLNTAGNVT